MIDLRKVLTLLTCCMCLTVPTPAWADFVGVVSEFKTDAETLSRCGEDLGLTVCNVFAQFDEENDRLVAVAFSDLQVMDGGATDVFYHHTFGRDTPYPCALLAVFPDLICDSFVAIGENCVGLGAARIDADFDSGEFNNNGHIVGGWFNGWMSSGVGDPFNHLNPDGNILILQSAVAVGSSLAGPATIFWKKIGHPEIFENEVEIICEAECPEGEVCDDGNACTAPEGICTKQTCVADPIDCDDGHPCTDDDCDPDSGCVHIPNDGSCDDSNECTDDSCDLESGCVHTPINLECPEGHACDPDTGECVAVPVGFLDIIPGKCPNRLQRNGLGFLKVSLVSASEADGGPFNACDVDVSTIQLCRADGTGGCAEPTSNPAPRCGDRATPFLGELCGCHGHRKDGLDDLDMRFKMADVVNNLGLADMPAGVSVGLELTALTNDGQNVTARDCVELGRDLGPNP